MASVAKWLRQWIVVPPFVGSSPIVRPLYVPEMTGYLTKNSWWKAGVNHYLLIYFDLEIIIGEKWALLKCNGK